MRSGDDGARRARFVLQSNWSDVRGLRPDQSPLAQLLEAVRGPAEHTTHRERRREQFRRQTETMKQQRRIELDVGVEPAVGLVVSQQTQRRRLDLACEIVD